MKRVIAIAPLLAALALAACGGGGDGGGDTSAPASAGAGTQTVALRQVAGVGRVLVDKTGKAIYASDLEKSGTIACTGGCTSFWKPVTATGGMPTGPAGAGELGVVKRPDGTKQLTANGRPLYTFSEDSAGKAKGDGFTDDFGGRHFTWHVVRSGGKTESKAGSGGGTGSDDSGSSTYDYDY